MTKIITIQPGQHGEGMGYNVLKKLPYPFHIDGETGKCVRGQGVTKTFTWRLMGFQNRKEEIILTREQFHLTPHRAIGKYAVFYTGSGITALTVPITDFTITELITTKKEVAP